MKEEFIKKASTLLSSICLFYCHKLEFRHNHLNTSRPYLFLYLKKTLYNLYLNRILFQI